MVTEFAAAKINLSLRVTGRRSDGYHLLDSVVAFADVGDLLTFEPADEFSLRITGPFAADLAADKDNLVMRAAHSLAAAFPGKIRRAHMTLEKNLPIASGIGGGSADAAATLRGLCGLCAFHPPLHGLALSLGADVPVCLESRACHMRGIGEEIEAIADFAPRHAVLVNPGVEVSTREVFARLVIARSPGEDWRNDLAAPAQALEPVIADVIAALRRRRGSDYVAMSGSGATCFGIFATAQESAEAVESIRMTWPRWWCKAVILT